MAYVQCSLLCTRLRSAVAMVHVDIHAVCVVVSWGQDKGLGQ